MRSGRVTPGTRRRRTAAIAGSVVAAVALTAGTATSYGSAGAPTASCGSVPAATANDPGNLLKKIGLSAAVRANYKGYGSVIQRSKWAKWKPKHKPPYTVGIAWGPQVNTYQTYILNRTVKYLKTSKLVGKVIAMNATSPADITGQIQQYQSLVQQKVDIIITEPNSPAAMKSTIDAAGAQGIPTVLGLQNLDSPYTVDVGPNVFQAAAGPAASMVKALGGNGNILEVHGVPTSTGDVEAFDAFSKVFALCPGIKVLGSVNGFFSPPATQGGVLQFLSTHTQKVDGAVQTATMAPAIIKAFVQAGRPVPIVAGQGAQKGDIGYWNGHKSWRDFQSVAGATSLSKLITDVTLRLLAGQGPKIGDIVWPQPLLTPSTMSKFAHSSWTVDTLGAVENPKSTWLTKSEIDSFFSHPKLPIYFQY